MNWKEKLRTIKKHVGKKPDEMERYSQSYSLIESCAICPLNIYVDIICNNNLKALILQGNPNEEILEAAKIGLIIEFSELSGNMQSRSLNNVIRQIYLYKSQITALHLCVSLICSGDTEIPYAYFKSCNINVSIPQTDKEYASLLKKVEGIIKGKSIQLKEAFKRYQTMSKESDTHKPTIQSFIDQLVLLSKHVGFNLSINQITLAEYASYLKNYKEYGDKQQRPSTKGRS